MTLRYIFHSGFLLETDRCILVFDYWMDPADVMSGYMNTCKHVYVFSSHFHEDHFTKAILRWKNSIPNIALCWIGGLETAEHTVHCHTPCMVMLDIFIVPFQYCLLNT